MLWTFLLYQTPQYLYYILPLSVLLATLVTIGVLTKNSELVVMKACGISLYRVALPMVGAAVCRWRQLFVLEQTVLGPANRRAEAIRHVMRGGSPETFDVLNRRWVVGSDGDIYHFNYFDPRQRRFTGLSIYEFNADMTRLTTAHVRASGPRSSRTRRWQVEQGWTREFDDNGEPADFAPFEQDAQGRSSRRRSSRRSTRSGLHELLAAARLHRAAARQRTRRHRAAGRARGGNSRSRSSRSS